MRNDELAYRFREAMAMAWFLDRKEDAARSIAARLRGYCHRSCRVSLTTGITLGATWARPGWGWF